MPDRKPITPRRDNGGDAAVMPSGPELKHAAETGNMAVFETLLRINKNDLDTECEIFPQVFFYVSDALTFLQSRRDALTNEIKDMEADLYLDYRSQPVAEGEKRPTEKEIEASVRSDREITKKRETRDAFNENFFKLSAMKDAFQQRSYMLTNLVTLSCANYYSQSVGEPRGPMREQRLEDMAARARASEPRYDRAAQRQSPNKPVRR